MRVLYIGQFSHGTTSRMRGECLGNVLSPSEFSVIDTHMPFFETSKLWRSFGFRFKRGHLIKKLNAYVSERVKGNYDVIWVDKAVFIKKKVTKELKQKTRLLIHYTPDTAFYENKSHHFYKSINYYDFLVSTKSFEREFYLKYIQKEKLLMTTQGFDINVHYPRNSFSEKENYVIFIGLNEPARELVIEQLLKNDIKVKLAGKNWEAFLKRTINSNLEYLGDSLFKDDYSETISRAYFGLGLLSKRFPELHTTRTFEIPACGTALLTERNIETSETFDDDEVVFFSNTEELVSKIKALLQDKKRLAKITDKGFQKVTQKGFDYESQIQKICTEIKLLE